MKFFITAWNGCKSETPNGINDAKRLSKELDAYLSTVSNVLGWFIGCKGFLIVGEDENTFGLFVDGCDMEKPVAEFNADNYANSITLAVDIIRAYNRVF